VKPDARVLAVIPARGGSKGLPGKNVRHLAGLPLLVHSLSCAARCAAITRTIVSTDDPIITRVARQYGGDVPFTRPAHLASDTVAMWPVLRHALAEVEREEGRPYDFLVLLDPTSPTRLPSDLDGVLAAVRDDADTALTVSEPHFSPYWHMYVPDEEGYAKPLIPGRPIIRRQDCPPAFFINGLAYAWETGFLRTQDTWVHGRTRMVRVPLARAVSIDTEEDFEWADRLLRSGLIRVPWLEDAHGALA